MTTTQSEDPNERIDHPRHYNQSKSGIECIELIEHLPCNLANAIKYIWRCGLKATETPLRDLGSAKWYLAREIERIDLYDLHDAPKQPTEIVWRAIARRVIISDELDLLAACLRSILDNDLHDAVLTIQEEIDSMLEAAATGG